MKTALIFISSLILLSCGVSPDNDEIKVIQSINVDNNQEMVTDHQPSMLMQATVNVAANDTGLVVDATAVNASVLSIILDDNWISAPMTEPISVVLHLPTGQHIIAITAASDYAVYIPIHAAHLSLLRLGQ